MLTVGAVLLSRLRFFVVNEINLFGDFHAHVAADALKPSKIFLSDCLHDVFQQVSNVALEDCLGIEGKSGRGAATTGLWRFDARAS